MNYLSLATRYRPQTFASVAGQPLAAQALSRAAATDKVAPAYLLSGTRGVGKTTIARIFAKALNCKNAPGPEPCNECAQCRHITAGNHVDVNEIDGASNTGVEDVRALRETIGFLPMEGRYKIYIIDEAHMLSKSAFNALLKTLEEPPAHTVFIFATTEAHRFPPTIISRCQHFVFRHLSEDAIYKHLNHILNLENIKFEETALHLLARRAAGSVRDSLSLLDQTLAVSDDILTAATVREALGVAGPELFDQLLGAITTRDMAKIMDLAAGLLHSGVDMGFFTRELGALWRNLFLLRQAGENILPAIANLTDNEKESLRKHAPALTASHFHAAWQMTLESQRAIAQSPEPGAVLELLLLNLAFLPQLLPVGSVPPQASPGLEEAAPSSYAPATENAAPAPRNPAPQAPAGASFVVPQTSQRPTYPASSVAGQPNQTQISPQTQASPQASASQPNAPRQTQPSPQTQPNPQSPPNNPPTWAAFCDFCRQEQEAGRPAPPQHILRAVQAAWQGNALQLKIASESLASQIESNKRQLHSLLERYCGGQRPEVSLLKPKPPRTPEEMRAECADDPKLKLCAEILGAEIKGFEDKKL